MKIKALVGGGLALLFAALLIYAWEEGLSLVQIFVGFVLFILPSIFFGSLSSGRVVFILIFSASMLSYAAYKMEWNDAWLGVGMAVLTGFLINALTIKPHKVFDAEGYKSRMKQKHQSE